MHPDCHTHVTTKWVSGPYRDPQLPGSGWSVQPAEVQPTQRFPAGQASQHKVLEYFIRLTKCLFMYIYLFRQNTRHLTAWARLPFRESAHGNLQILPSQIFTAGEHGEKPRMQSRPTPESWQVSHHSSSSCPTQAPLASRKLLETQCRQRFANHARNP